MTQKIQCQLSPWVTAPPISGPQATASPATPPQIPTMAPRRSGGKDAVSIVRPSGMMIAAPIPSTARNAIRAATSGATAQPAEAAVNSARPARYIRRLPIRSPIAAAVMMPAPKASTYALTVHCRVPTFPPRSRWIDGSAVTTTRESRVTMKYATDVSSTVQVPWPTLRDTAARPGRQAHPS